MTNPPDKIDIYGGVDTHADTHHAAVIDINGRHLGDAQFPTTPAGYAALTAFILTFGALIRIGIEGTGSYGAGLARHLRNLDLEIVEVIRPNRQLRRMRGKTDPIDAYAAAQTAMAESHHPVPKTGDGNIEAIRYLFTVRRSAVKARTTAQVQMKSLLVTAPELLRERFRSATDMALIRDAAKLKTADYPEYVSAVIALRVLARRHQYLTQEITNLDTSLTKLVTDTNLALLAAKGIGTVTAAQLLITAGDNPDRLRSEAAFAALCGASPIPASSGKTSRHRLNRGGDRQANSALHQIALVRMSNDPRTRTYVSKKRGEGKSSREVLRCLKRAIAREVFTLLTKPVEIPRFDDLRPLRKALGVSMDIPAEHFGIWVSRLSRIERGLTRDDAFVIEYREWLETYEPEN